MHFLKWEKVFKHRGLGGLNVPILKARNFALLGKWWWMRREYKDNLWQIILSEIYECTNGKGLDVLQGNNINHM